MGQVKLVSKLLRVEQWYKNLVVFLALLFSGNLFNFEYFGMTLIAFLALCLISSANYVINDLKDKHKDVKHPLKKNRPIAAGLVSEPIAHYWVSGLLLSGLFLSYLINEYFLVLVVGLFLLMQCYTFWLKKYLYLDVFMISTFFVVRAVLGAFAILVWVSPWLIICPFFLAMFLASGKRYADIALLSEKAESTRKVLKKYSLAKAKKMLIFSVIMLVFSFVLYSIQKNLLFLWSVPFAIFALFRYLQLIFVDAHVGIRSELALKDRKLVIFTCLWLFVVLFVLYF